MNTEKQRKFLINTAFIATVIILFYIVLKLLSGVLFPFAAAAVLTVSLQRFIRKWSSKLKLKKKAASVAVIIFVYIIAGGTIISIGYALYRQLTGLVASLPQYVGYFTDAVKTVGEKLNSLSNRMPESMGSFIDGFPTAAAQKLTEGAASWATEAAKSLAAGVPYFLLSVLVMVISSAYFAKDYDEICHFFLNKLSRSVVDGIRFAKYVILKNFINMLRGYVLIMLITFAELFIGLMLLGFKYALITAAITAVLDILPVLGSGTVLLPWAIFCAVSGDTKHAVGLVVLYLIITFVRNIVEPKIVGSKVGIHPLIMLAAAFLGLKLFGATGIILLPIAAIVVKSYYESKGIEFKYGETPKKPTKLCVKNVSFKREKNNRIKRGCNK